MSGVLGNTRAAFAEERLELGQQLALEDGLENAELDEVAAAVDEAVVAEPTAGDETVSRPVSCLPPPSLEDPMRPEHACSNPA